MSEHPKSFSGLFPRAPFVRNPYNYDVDKASAESALLCEDKSLTVQSEAEDADINTIVKRFGLTGELPQNVRVPLPEDFVQTSDYHTALNQLIAADEAFMQFPAEVRARFKHDPAELIAFVADDKNYEEAVKLGIANARPPASSPAASTPSAPAATDAPSAG